MRHIRSAVAVVRRWSHSCSGEATLYVGRCSIGGMVHARLLAKKKNEIKSLI